LEQLPELPFIELSVTDSTNNYALHQIHAGLARHGTAYFAREQSAGKGQRGKSWLADKDQSVLLSVVVNPHPLPVQRQFEFSACVAVTVARFCETYAGRDIKIKWPNDIYWQDRKAGGILIENVVKAGSDKAQNHGRELNARAVWEWAVAGIGLNIGQQHFPENLENPVSLKQITGVSYHPSGLAKELQLLIVNNFKRLVSSDGGINFYNDYIELLYKRGETVKLKRANMVFEATIIGVTRQGRLLARHAFEEEIDHGAVEWLLPG
jgi:BirA family biotin operon repressor/biotin-[acetyl-CoA-carboxylase] ligase